MLLAACGDSEPGPSDAGLAPPTAPSAVRAVAADDRVSIEWDDESASEVEFVIARATVATVTTRPPAEALVIIGSTAQDQTSFEDDDVLPGVYYVYGVASRGAGGRSAFTLQSGDAAVVRPQLGACGGTPSDDDLDGDGLPNEVELEGWTVRVDEDGQGNFSTRLVKSSIYDADTDGDGLCDAEESSLKTDPRRADTDGDGLSDPDEILRWGSSPVSVDSDQDAEGNSLFYDGAELANFGTSPTLADTDGDGRSDFQEVNQNGTNPLVADLPQPRIDLVGTIDLGVNVRLENGTVVSDAVTTGLERTNSTAAEQTSGTATQQSVESSASVILEATAGYPASAGASVTGSYSETQTYVQESSSSVTREARQSAQQSYETLSNNAITQNQEIVDGRLAVNIVIENTGTRTFELSNLVVTALRRDRANPSTFTSVASLTLPEEANGLVLGEGDRRGPFRVGATITGNAALDLLANPSALFFRAASFQLSDRTGESFDFAIGDETSNRTALLTIDFGGYRPLEKYRVATNVERGADGRAAGVRLGDVFERILGLTPSIGYETQARSDGVQVLTRVRNVESAPSPAGGAERFWVIIAANNPNNAITPAAERLLDRTKNFDELILMPRDSVFLAFVADADRDGLFDREERLYGTSDEVVDSDGDGLSDFEEVRTGWDVEVDHNFYRANRRVFSNPSLSDIDGDGWDDAKERAEGTDPNRKDTDGDGLSDDIDPEPLRGPTGTWVRLIGTLQPETALQVLTASDTVYLLGHSAGDIDADGTPNGPFVMALEPGDGSTRWVSQLEGVTEYAQQLSVEPDGRVTFVGELPSGVLPSVTTNALHALQWDRGGQLLATNDLTNAGHVGSHLPNDVIPYAMVRVPSGGSFVFMRKRLLNNQEALHRLVLDANAAYVTSLSSWDGRVPEVKHVYTAGHLVVSAIDYAANGCAATFLHTNGDFVGAPVNFCAPDRVERVALDEENALYVVLRDNGLDRLRRMGLAGFPNLWTRDYPSFISPSITALDIDDTDQVYVGVQDAGALTSATLEILNPDQSVRSTLILGNTTTRVVGTQRDRVGNLFLIGSSTGGFDSFATARGGSDVLLIRNPQFNFQE